MSQVVENELQVGDLVRVIAPDSLLHGLEGRIAQTDFGAGEDPYKFESACGEHRGWLSAYQLRKLTVSSVEGEPHRDGLVLRSEWNAKEGCFEDSRVDPEKESHWEPKPYEWVRLPDQTVLPVHGYEIHGGKTYYCFEGTNDKFALGFLRPWVPRRGEKVQVINANQVYEVQSFDKTTKVVFCVGCYAGIQLRLLKPYIEQPAKEPERIACNHQVCELAKPTGVTCPPDSCDIDDGVRELPVEQPAIDEPTPESQGHPDHVGGVWVEEGINATSINFKPKRPVVYIAGPMRGIPHFNFPAFDAAKAYLIGKGYDVLSPADFDRELDGFDPYEPEYETAEGCADFPKTMDFWRVVTRDLTAVTQCDFIASLPYWEKSKGAVAEIAVANWMGKPVIHLLCNAYRHNEVEYTVTAASTTLEQFVSRLAYAHGEAVKEAICPPPPEQNPDCDILEVAASITRGDRQAVYGPPDQDFKKTADMWTGMFQFILADGAKFEPRHVAMAMICIKLSREFHQRKRDNWIDIAGYARCGSLCSS